MYNSIRSVYVVLEDLMKRIFEENALKNAKKLLNATLEISNIACPYIPRHCSMSSLDLRLVSDGCEDLTICHQPSPQVSIAPMGSW